MEKIILTTFTDPMMGLSYESEPIMERLQKEFGDVIEFKYVMGLLVRWERGTVPLSHFVLKESAENDIF